MDKRTIIAVVASVLVITLGFVIQGALFAPDPTDPALGDTVSEAPDTPPVVDPSQEAEPDPVLGQVVPVEEPGISQQPRTFSDGTTWEVTFSPIGGTITSFRLLQHLDEGEPVEMLLRSNDSQHAFDLRFGGPEAPTVDALFSFSQVNEWTYAFSREFYIVGAADKPFTLTKTYRFRPEEYMFEFDVTVANSVNEVVPLVFNGRAYTLTVGPQIGPDFQSLDGRTDYRRFSALIDNGRRDFNPRPATTETVQERVGWASINGKYFAIIGIPGRAEYSIVFDKPIIEGLPESAYLHFVRPTIGASTNTDTFRFFVGPKSAGVLDRYDDPEQNAFGVRDVNLGEVMDRRPLLGWLESGLKWILQLFQSIVGNWGVAIVMLTILVKAALFPLTRKSYKSNSKMQALAPKIKELKEKHKDNPQKANTETAALYKKEGVNPLGGCLPLLLQLPFFLAMFGLFNNHFDLRGAVFISGWISDLSAPESILNFGSFTVPILGWNDLRLLPIIYVGTQIITSRLTSNPNSSSGGNMKIMMYALPVVFFFILYNMPSGLLVYWITTNLLTAGQQYFYNRYKNRGGGEPVKPKGK